MKMSNKICEAEACENSRRNCNLSFFSFPENDPKRIGKWTANIKLKKSCRKNRVLCSDHFEIKAFADTLKRRLHRNAVPTIQNPVEDEPPKKFPCLEGFHCAK